MRTLIESDSIAARMNSDITEILKKAQSAPTGHAQLVETNSDDEMTVGAPVKGF